MRGEYTPVSLNKNSKFLPIALKKIAMVTPESGKISGKYIILLIF